jgi:hypothetical protein
VASWWIEGANPSGVFNANGVSNANDDKDSGARRSGRSRGRVTGFNNLWMFGVHAGKLLAARWDGHSWLTRTPPGNQLLDTAAVTFGPADTWD